MTVLNVYRVNKSYAVFKPPKDTVVADVSDMMDADSIDPDGELFRSLYKARVGNKKHVLFVYGGFDETGPVEKMFLLTKADIDDPRQYGMSKHKTLELLFRAKRSQSKSKSKKSKSKKSPAKKSKSKKSKSKKSPAKKSKSKKSPAKKTKPSTC